jgi:hypothetical protein
MIRTAAGRRLPDCHEVGGRRPDARRGVTAYALGPAPATGLRHVPADTIAA